MTFLRGLIFPLIAVFCAFAVGALVVLFIGDSPVKRAPAPWKRLLLARRDWLHVVLRDAPDLHRACRGRCVARRAAQHRRRRAAVCRRVATAWVGIKLAGLPAVVLVPLCCLAAIGAGAVWGAIPGLLKARFGSHEVINTIMLNFIAVALVGYLTQYHYRIPGDPIMESAPISDAAHIARLGRFVPGLPERIPVNVAFLFALVACWLVYVLLWKTKWGYEIRATGQNPAAAEYGGVSVRKEIVLTMAISGALAGMVGINEVLGYRHRYYDGFSDNYGFTGIAVALLGRNHPLGVIVAALLFAVLQRGGVPVDAFTHLVSKDIVLILQALVILFVAAEAMFRGPINRFGFLRAAGGGQPAAGSKI